MGSFPKTLQRYTIIRIYAGELFAKEGFWSIIPPKENKKPTWLAWVLGIKRRIFGALAAMQSPSDLTANKGTRVLQLCTKDVVGLAVADDEELTVSDELLAISF